MLNNNFQLLIEFRPEVYQALVITLSDQIQNNKLQLVLKIINKNINMEKIQTGVSMQLRLLTV